MRHRIPFSAFEYSAFCTGGVSLNRAASVKGCFRQTWVITFLVLVALCVVPKVQAATNRSTYILYDSSWMVAPDFRSIAFDSLHRQIFTAWTDLDRIDVLSAADYHLIRSICVPSPSSVDISPDGSTLAVGTSSAHILFFDTSTFAKTNDVVFPDSALGITAFVYTANGNAFVRAAAGLSTGGGITAYWDHIANSFRNESAAVGATGIYQTNGPLGRSGDYSRIMLGDATSGGGVQIIDGNTGQVLQQLGFGDYIFGLAANKNADRYAICVNPSSLVVLDASFDEIYQDVTGCIRVAFSADGSTLYRDGSVNSVGYTQSIDMTTFAIRNTENYFSHSGGLYTQWEVADDTGMVYGMNPNIPSGAVFVAVDTTTTATPAIPAPDDPLHILRVIDNIGSPQGGDSIRLLCTGVDNDVASSLSVVIGGATATSLVVAPVGPFPPPNLPYLRLITVKTPPGATGLVDVTLNANGKSDTAGKAFQYARSTKLFPFSTSPTFLVYDSLRQRLYAAHKDQVEVIDTVALQVLAPLVPASGKLPNSQFAGMSLSRDGSRLYIADAGANLIHVLDLNNPGQGTSIDPNKAIASLNPISPARVVETSDGKLLASSLPAWPFPFTLDPKTGTGAQLVDTLGNKAGGVVWNSTNQGEHVLISADIDEPISSRVAMWNVSTSDYISSANETVGMIQATANEDGTVIATGGANTAQSLNPEIVDFNLNSMGFINQHYDVAMPIGAPSLSFHASGALLYQAGTTPSGGSVEIDDVHQLKPAATIVFPEPFVSYFAPLTDHVLAADPTGRSFFGVTKSGISMVVLDSIPLSVGNLQPAFGQTGGGQAVTIRGSGFQSGAVASFDGVPAATAFVDENTLTAVTPPLSAGWQDVKVTNANGNSYTISGSFQILGTLLTPAITGFLPSSVGLTLSEQPLPVTIIGSGFDNYDWVEINGQPVDSSFVDASHIQAVIPWQLTGKTGSISFTVVSPYAGPSNISLLPLVNAVPVVHSIWPLTLATGNPTSNFDVSGVDFVSGSVVQWTGQNLATTVVDDGLLIASVPANLLANSETAAITVFNPLPGGGSSNALNMDVSPAHPLVSYPANINFGTALLNNPVTQTVQLVNVGSASYTISSASISTGPFTVLGNSCNNIPFTPPYSASCTLQLQFSPTIGTSNATLIITDNALGSPHSLPVTGIGTQNLVPLVAITSIDSLGQTVSASINGNATVGGSGIPATAWVEYGTDPGLATFGTSTQWSFTGDSAISGAISGLTPATTYAARLVVQTTGGTGKSSVRLFATMPAWPWVAFSLASGSSNVATVSAGQTATYQLLVSDGGNGYAGIATFSCSGAPSGATCTVSPSSAKIGVNGTPVTVTITTSVASSARLRPVLGGPIWAFGLLMGAIAIAVPKRLRGFSLLVCVVTLMLLIPGCGGSTSGSGPSPGGVTTPSGTYYLTITGSTGGAQNTFLLTLTVK
jgi:hypothetical protein